MNQARLKKKIPKPILPVVYVGSNGADPPQYRTWVHYQWGWTPDIEKAVWYARRDDIELVHAEDEDNVYVIEHTPATEARSMQLPTVLGSLDGNRVTPQITRPADLEKLKLMRTQQYLNDRNDALRGMSVQEWIKFCLRWGLAPPPQGFEDHRTLRCVMHKVRLCLTTTTHEQALESAIHLKGQGVPLPGSMTLIDGVLSGDPNARPQ